MPYLLSRDADEFLVNTITSNPQDGAKVVSLAGGGFVIAWTDYSDADGASGLSVKAQLFDSNGDPVGSELVLNSGVAGDQTLSDLAATSNGGFVATWSDRQYDQQTGVNTLEIEAQFFDANGAKIGSEFNVNATLAGTEFATTIASLSNGHYVFVWTKDGAVQARRYDGDGQSIGGDISIAPGIAPAGVGLIGGRYVLSWQQGSDLKLQLFEANGTPVGDPFGIGHLSDTTQRAPELLALPNGGFVVTWEYNISGNADIMMQAFNAQGQATTPVVQVSERTGQQGAPDIAALPDGGFLISWSDTSRLFGDLSSWGIVAQTFNADGTKSGTNFGINTVTADVQIAPTVASLPDGRLVIAWTGYDGSYSGIRAQLFEPSTGPDDISLSTTTVSEVATENLAVATISSSGSVNGVGTSTYAYLSDSAGGAFRLEGNRLVIADNGRLDFETAPTVSVTLRVTDEAGNSFDETITLDVADVAQEIRYGAGAVRHADFTGQLDLVALSSGGFVLLGGATDPPNSGTSAEVGAQYFDATGNALDAKSIVNTNRHVGQFDADGVQLAGGNVVAVWTDNSVVGADTSVSSIRGQLLGPDGARIGSEFIVNSTVEAGQTWATVDALLAGGFVVTWTDDSRLGGDAFGWSIKARLFDAMGAPLGNEFLVNTTALGNQYLPQVAALASGGFVIAWSDSNDAQDVIRAQIFNAQGAKVGAELLVSTPSDNGLGVDGIAGLAGGGFVVIYQGDGPAEDGGLVGQVFAADGTKLGAEFQVNSRLDGSQFWGAVTPLSTGGFVVTWVSQADYVADPASGGLRDVRAQLFDATGAKVGAEFQADYGGDTFGAEPTVAELADGRIVIAWQGNDANYRILTPSQPVSAVADSGTTLENLALTGNVLANDLHDAGAILRVGSVNGQASVVGHAITLASGARVTVNADGSYNYNPNGAFVALTTGATATDSFTYGLTNGTSATATITITGVDPFVGDAGNNNFGGTPGDDSFLLQQGGDDTAFGQGGNDGFYFGGALTMTDQADGGAGTDTLALQGNYGGLVLSGVTNVEVLLAASGSDTRFGDTANNRYDYSITTVDANVAAGGTLTVIGSELLAGEDLIFNGAAETDGRFRIFAGRGNDQLTGGAGSDGFFFGADGNLTGADRVNGGAGTDSIALRGNYVGATAVVFQDASFTNVEVLTFLSGHTNEFGGFIDTNGFDYDVTLANGNIAAGQRLDIIAGNLRANESARVDARAELDGSVRIISGAGDDTLFGSAGNDILSGGLGADLLDGSAGNDSYVYRLTGESTAAARDTISFGAGDRIDLSLIDANGGTAANEAFTFIGSAAFSNVAGQLRAVQAGADWIVEGDVNGDGAADLVIAGTSAAPLVIADFVL